MSEFLCRFKGLLISKSSVPTWRQLASILQEPTCDEVRAIHVALLRPLIGRCIAAAADKGVRARKPLSCDRLLVRPQHPPCVHHENRSSSCRAGGVQFFDSFLVMPDPECLLSASACDPRSAYTYIGHVSMQIYRFMIYVHEAFWCMTQ